MIFKRLILVSALATLTACSTVENTAFEQTETIKTEFIGGDLILNFTKDGQFEFLTASGTARVTSNLPSAVEEAYVVASLRAKQKVVEFMNNEMEGEKFVDTINDSLQESFASNGQSIVDVNSQIAYKVQENIKSKSKAILQGVSVDQKSFDKSSNTVRVTVRTGVREIATARQIRTLMGN
jgi:hypothetical protein